MMKIGELAKVTGCSVQTIRHYEKEHLIASAERSEGNFRLYNETAVEQFLFIKHCRSLDLSLPEIRQLLALTHSPGAQCADINRMMDTHIEQVDARIRDLTNLSKQLKALRRSCSNQRTVEQCGILKNLSVTPASKG